MKKHSYLLLLLLLLLLLFFLSIVVVVVVVVGLSTGLEFTTSEGIGLGNGSERVVEGKVVVENAVGNEVERGTS